MAFFDELLVSIKNRIRQDSEKNNIVIYDNKGYYLYNSYLYILLSKKNIARNNSPQPLLELECKHTTLFQIKI